MENNDNEIRSAIRKFVMDNFHYSVGNVKIEDITSFYDMGVIDSTGILELIEFIEDRFGIKIEDDEVIPMNLDSLSNIEKYVLSKFKNELHSPEQTVC